MDAQMGLRIVKRRQLVDEVISQLQEQISLGEYKVGSKIPTEAELMRLLGVSRTTVREAVRVLANNGLLDVRQGDGTYVKARSAEVEPLEWRLRHAKIRDIYEVRRMLELEIVRLAVERRTEADLGVMRASLAAKAAARRDGRLEDYVAADVEFHRAIAVASKNSVLVDLYEAFSSAVRDALVQLLQVQAALDYDAIAHSHQELLQALERQDAAGAEKWTVEHVDSILQCLQ